MSLRVPTGIIHRKNGIGTGRRVLRLNWSTERYRGHDQHRNRASWKIKFSRRINGPFIAGLVGSTASIYSFPLCLRIESLILCEHLRNLISAKSMHYQNKTLFISFQWKILKIVSDRDNSKSLNKIFNISPIFITKF